jgi:hypothetical protein
MVQFIEFKYYNDRYSSNKIDKKTIKYDRLIEDIKAEDGKWTHSWSSPQGHEAAHTKPQFPH